MFCTPLGLAIALIHKGKYNAQWVCLPSISSSRCQLLYLVVFLWLMQCACVSEIPHTYTCGSYRIIFVWMPSHLYLHVSSQNTALQPNVTLISQHTSTLSSSTYPSSSGEDQREQRFHIEPIKLMGRCCAGTSICLRSHYKHTSMS